MSVAETFGSTSIALRPHWEMVLCDETGSPMDWTRPLVKSTNAPRLKLLVENKDGGTRPAFVGYELPDALQIEMYETTDHKVEQYLDSWLFGEKGAFNLEKGVFRSLESLDNIYRNIIFTTTKYKVEEDGAYAVAAKEVTNSLMAVFAKRSECNTGVFKAILNTEIARIFAEPIIEKQQIAAIITGAASQAINQTVGNLSFMTGGIVKPNPVVIPPPTVMAIKSFPVVLPKVLVTPATKTVKAKVISFDELKLVGNIAERIREIKLSGESSVKKFKASEVVTSRVTYKCLLQDFDIGTYDYDAGGPVTYTVTLPIYDYKAEVGESS